VSAHPVTWKGGKALMVQQDSLSSSLIGHYSVGPAWSLGGRLQVFQPDDEPFIIGQSNWLLKRWNDTSAQGNLFLLSGIGASTKRDNNQGILHIGVQADWETREIYTYSLLNYYQTDVGLLTYRGRVGVAPYVADFEDIHTWLIAQVDYANRNGHETLSVMPVIRLFQDNILVEFGSDFSGHTLVSGMLHF
jgi:hypothetical protein